MRYFPRRLTLRTVSPNKASLKISKLVLKSNAKIIEKLKEVQALYAIEEIIHQYPHCWRCHEPIIFRATEQWFASVDAIKEDAVKAIKGVKWLTHFKKNIVC